MKCSAVMKLCTASKAPSPSVSLERRAWTIGALKSRLSRVFGGGGVFLFSPRLGILPEYRHLLPWLAELGRSR